MNYPIVLASGSPRRKELLEQIGLKFTVHPSPYEEDMSLDLSPAELARTLGFEKGKAVQELYPDDHVIISADTVVAHGDQVFGKPKSEQEAFEVLKTLSGSTHQVITGFSILHTASDTEISEADINDIHFYDISEDEIWEYIRTGDPMDKAGAYGVQGFAARFVKGLEGDYNSIVGIPAGKVFQYLKEIK